MRGGDIIHAPLSADQPRVSRIHWPQIRDNVSIIIATSGVIRRVPRAKAHMYLILSNCMCLKLVGSLYLMNQDCIRM